MTNARCIWGDREERPKRGASARAQSCEVVNEPMPEQLLGVCIPGPLWPVVFVSTACTVREEQRFIERMARLGFPPHIWRAP